MMLSVDEALRFVLEQTRPRDPVVCLLADLPGLVLAEDVVADVDSPPHDKSLVDGYAIVAADLVGGSAELEVLEEITAGNVPSRSVAPGSTSRIMTGAPIPPGADAVVMIEQSEAAGGNGLGRVRLTSSRAAPGSNIMRRATSMARG